MKAICSLLPGADTPILFSEFSEDEEEEDSIEYADEDATESQEIFNESVIHKDTNGDVGFSLPHSTNKNFMQPLTVECDPVGSFVMLIMRFLHGLLHTNCYKSLTNFTNCNTFCKQLQVTRANVLSAINYCLLF